MQRTIEDGRNVIFFPFLWYSIHRGCRVFLNLMNYQKRIAQAKPKQEKEC